ncbi:MAG: Veg family protein [Defluviitaleaceae bacterium]|nr:Veg family protein [Defluviitaleaceae bacterium]
MYVRDDVTQIRRNLTEYVGSRVMLESNKGRQKSMVSSGTIQKTYPSIFTIVLDEVANQGPARTVSYSYTDVLTKNVEITVFSN